jgi:hypothetical protein
VVEQSVVKALLFGNALVFSVLFRRLAQQTTNEEICPCAAYLMRLLTGPTLVLLQFSPVLLPKLALIVGEGAATVESLTGSIL